MTVNPAYTEFKDGCVPDYDASEPDPTNNTLTASDPEGAFSAALYYIAADLQELAKVAPSHKAEPLSALVRLLRALAET